MAAGLGADVTICDISLKRLAYLTDVMPQNVKTLMSSEYNIREELKTADLVIGSVLIPGAKAPKLVTRDMLKDMEPGSVLVDVAIDQGGCFETSRPTTHEEPTYFVDGILHYCVANIPGAVPYTSTLGLTNATLPYAIQLADKGWRRACKENHELELGLGTEIRTAGPVKPTPQTIQSENPAIAALPTLWSPSFRTERQSLVFFSEYEAFV